MENAPVAPDEPLAGGASAALPPPTTDSAAAGVPPPVPERTGESAPAHSARLVGSLVGSTIGRYRIERRLGGGAMASVYAATVVESGAQVALKVLLPDADETVRQRFRLEARMVSELDHPHIVHTLEVGGHGDGADEPGAAEGGGASAAGAASASGSAGEEPLPPTFIAMELVQGESLGEFLDRVRTLNAIDAAALLAPVGRALAYAHARGVVHRDVKPSNILLRKAPPGSPGAVRLSAADEPMVPLLSDFGIARALDAPELTSAGRTIGTPAYMSPEQCAGDREISGRADIYSLGAVLYRALVGRSPYSGSTTQILYAHVYEPLTIPEEVLLTLPPLLVDVLRRSMAKDAEDRYPTALAMANDLSAVAGRQVTEELPIVTAEAGEPTATMMSVAQVRGADVDGADLPAPVNRTNSVVLVAVKPPEARGQGSAAGATAAASAMDLPGAGAANQPAYHPATTSATLAATITPQTPPPQSAVMRTSTFYVVPQAAVPAPQAVKRTRRGAYVALAIVAPVLLLLAIAVAALLQIGPFGDRSSGRPGAVETAAAAAPGTPGNEALQPGDAQPTAPAIPVVDGAAGTGAGTPEPGSPDPTTGEAGAGAGAGASVPPATPSPAEEPTPTPPLERPTPAGDIAGFWAEAQEFVDERDWGSALSWLTLVQRIDPDFEQVRVQQLLGQTLVSLGAQANRRGDAELALQQLQRAAELEPQNQALADLLDATRVVAEAEGPAADNARRLLQISHISYSDAMVRTNRICDAADHMEAAERIYPESRVEALSADLARRCAVLEAARADQRLLESLPGRLIYSTQLADGRYAIYSVSPVPGSLPQLLVADARQPAVSGDGTMLAFHRTTTGEQGLFVAPFNTLAGLTGDALRLGDAPWAAADSPAAWNFAGTELVFAGTDPANGRSLLFRSGLPGEGPPQAVGGGQAPAWNWVNDLVAFNGVDGAGRTAGLYQMLPDGTRVGPGDGVLTDNGNDTRPAWSPDGATLTFMSSGRSGSWELFQLAPDAGALTQLTADPAQDGLPAISPDGRFVAWMSDRGGRWNIWVQALPASGEGGDAEAPRDLLLAPVEGSLTNWLEHSLVWIP